MSSLSVVLSALLLLSSIESSLIERVCLERIWPEFQRCRERQIEHHRYGRYASSLGWHLASSDVYQPKYKMECCSYWDLVECVHRAAKAYCPDDVSLIKLDKSLEMLGLNVPVYICLEEYPKGSYRCRLPWWLIMLSIFGLVVVFMLIVAAYLCLKGGHGGGGVGGDDDRKRKERR